MPTSRADAIADAARNADSIITQYKRKSIGPKRQYKQQLLRQQHRRLRSVHRQANLIPKTKAMIGGASAKTMGFRINAAIIINASFQGSAAINCRPGQPVKILVCS